MYLLNVTLLLSWVGISYCLDMGNAMFERLYQTLSVIYGNATEALCGMNSKRTEVVRM